LNEFGSFVVIVTAMAGDELLSLDFDGFHDFGVAVTQGGDTVAAGAIHVFPPVVVPYQRAFASGDDDWFFGEHVCEVLVFYIHYFCVIH